MVRVESCMSAECILSLMNCVTKYFILCVLFTAQCSGSPCASDATCMNDGIEGFTCTCNEGYIGDGLTCDGKSVFLLLLPFFNVILGLHLTHHLFSPCNSYEMFQGRNKLSKPGTCTL